MIYNHLFAMEFDGGKYHPELKIHRRIISLRKYDGYRILNSYIFQNLSLLCY